MRRAALERFRLLQRQRERRALMRARGLPDEALALNHFRKQRRVGGCGNSRCWLCHGDKLAQRPDPQARRASAAWADGLKSLDPRA
jgi:hypothetical protein